ncbi:MAG: hypothetical protein ACOY5Y_06315 [Pseudomonadota bacterium]|jgi:hypothetical protein
MGASEPDPPREGPADDEVLDVGQEEVFSRTEVELGRIEHSTEAGRERPPQASSSMSQ